MDIKDFLKVITDGDILIYPLTDLTAKGRKLVVSPKFDKTELPYFVPKVGAYKPGKLIYSSETPTIYTTMRIDGIVKLDDNDGKLDEFETYTFLRYPLFYDGEPYSPYIIVSGEGCEKLDCEVSSKDGRMLFDMSKVTFDSYKAGEYDINNILKLTKKKYQLKAKRKVLNHFQNIYIQDDLIEKPDKSEKLKEEYPPELVKLLNDNFITDKGFNKPYKGKKKNKELDIVPKGMSSLPKVDDVIERVMDNKKQTTAGEVMAPTVMQCIEGKYEGDPHLIMDDLRKVEEETENISNKIREIRYGMSVEDKWFYNHPKPEIVKESIKHDDWIFNLKFRK